MNTDSIKNRFAQVFENDYQGYDYFIENVVNLIFTGDDAYEPLPVPEEFLTDEKRQRANESGILSILKVGTVDAEEPVDLYDITLSDRKELQYNRVGIQQFIRSELFSFTNAFMLFHNETPEGKDWRFSYAYKETTQKSMTSAKRYTYLFGKNHRARTASERFAKLAGEDKNTQNLLNAFSVEALSKDFFNEYKNQYNLFCKFISDHKNNPEFFGSKMAYWEDKSLRDYVKKMMGRITFIYFLQRKGWINGDMQYMQNAFQKSPHQDDYLDMFLEPLFFGVLNTKQKDRKTLFEKEGWDLSLLKEWKDVPYLNGGLFERDEHDQPKSKFPAEMFKNLFDFYARYNFTIDENDPDDAEVGVDPEMLGHIFENLLEDNKDKGAFYTPKEIVQYMCRESLIAYLTNCAEENTEHKYPHEQTEASVRMLVQTPEQIVPKMSHRQKEDFGKALREVKICDPAIGSGAFPMGLLNELVRLRIAIGAWADKANDIAALKREIIQNNIYGVDIEKGAVDIARLRFWLSIVVDSEQPEALPNFDYKFMQGNSLLESFDGFDLSHIMDNHTEVQSDKSKKLSYQRKIGGNENIQLKMDFTTEDTRENLNIWLKKYFSIDNHKEKTEYRTLINESVKNYIRHQGIKAETEAQLNELDPSANDRFFLWHTWFKDIFDNGGFDIVIGNPPWGADLSKESKSILKNTYPEIDSSTPNSYAYFIGWGLRYFTSSLMLVLPDSVLIKDFIRTRELLSSKVREVKWYQNCSVPKDKRLFKDVEHDICIVCLDNMNHSMVHFQTNNFENGSYVPKDNMVVKNEVFKKEFDFVFNLKATSTEWIIASKLLKHPPLDDIAQCHEGIHSGNVRDKLFIKGYKPNLKPMYYGGKAGDVIRPYVSYMCGWYVDYRASIINTEIGEYASLRDERLFILPKVYITRTGNPFKAFYDENSYASNNFFSLQIKDYEQNTKDNLLFLLPLINSKVCQFFIRRFAAPRLGDSFIETKIIHLLKFPIPPANSNQRHSIIILVDKILTAKKSNPQADTSVWEAEIDKLVYELYGLTEEEIKVVEGK